MIDLFILLAEPNKQEAESLEKAIGVKLDQPIEGVRIFVKIVTTLADVFVYAPKSNVILIDLYLDDAGPDEVIAAIPTLPEPVIVITANIEPAMHARCRLTGAQVIVKSLTRNNEIYSTILHCMGKSMRQALETQR